MDRHSLAGFCHKAILLYSLSTARSLLLTKLEQAIASARVWSADFQRRVILFLLSPKWLNRMRHHRNWQSVDNQLLALWRCSESPLANSVDRQSR